VFIVQGVSRPKGERRLLKRVLIGLLRSHETTGEKARYPELKTKYYKLGREKVWEELISILKKSRYKVLHEVRQVGEIVVEKKGIIRTLDITITLFSINPMQTAVDIYSASRGSFGDLGSNYFTILDIYKKLDNKLSSYKM
jgi:hypothetical protein